MDKNKFYIEISGKKYNATILTNFEVLGDNYCIYTVPSDTSGENNVYCAKIVEQYLVPIEDLKTRELTNKIITNLLSCIKGGQ